MRMGAPRSAALVALAALAAGIAAPALAQTAPPPRLVAPPTISAPPPVVVAPPTARITVPPPAPRVTPPPVQVPPAVTRVPPPVVRPSIPVARPTPPVVRPTPPIARPTPPILRPSPPVAVIRPVLPPPTPPRNPPRGTPASVDPVAPAVRPSARPPSNPPPRPPVVAQPAFGGDVPLPPRRVGSFEQPAVVAAGTFDPNEVVDREVVATLAPGLGDADAASLALDNDLSVRESASLDLVESLVVRLRIEDDRAIETVVAALTGDARVAIAGPNRVFRSQSSGPQYALERLGLVDPALPQGGGVPLAVIDTRPDIRHPELAPAGIRVESLLEGDDDVALDHGTQIVGLIAAADRLRGAAPAARITAIAAFTVDGEGRSVSTSFRLANALEVAAREGAKVVNMSFAGGEDALLARGLERLAENGVVLVAAAGNGGPDAPPAFPGSHPRVIAVTATDAADALYVQANRGEYVAVAAPGVDLIAPGANGRYVLSSGTSLAAAFVSAAAAMALERYPDATADQIRAALTGSAVDLGPAGRDAEFGWGLALPAATLEALSGEARAVMR